MMNGVESFSTWRLLVMFNCLLIVANDEEDGDNNEVSGGQGVINNVSSDNIDHDTKIFHQKYFMKDIIFPPAGDGEL